MRRWLRTNAESVYLCVVGLLLLAACWAAVVKGAEAGSATLALLGGGALVIAPFATRLQGTLKIGAVVMTLRQRVVGIAARASVETLEGVLPLLEGQDVVVRLVRLPDELVGHALSDPELGFIRKELQLSVVAIRLPAEEHWRAGGQVSDLDLPGDSELLVAGSHKAVKRLAEHP